jgi:hypothetical protein
MIEKWANLKAGDRFNLCYMDPKSETGRLINVSIKFYDQKPEKAENFAYFRGQNYLFVSFVPPGQLGMPKILVQTITKMIPVNELPDMEMRVNDSENLTLTYYYSGRD